MTQAQFRRSEAVCKALSGLVGDVEAAELLARIRGPGGRVDGRFDAELDDLIVVGESLVVARQVRGAPQIQDRRAHPRFSPERQVPVSFAHPEIGRENGGFLGDIGAGGVRLVAPPSVRPTLRWADPVSMVIVHCAETRQASIGGLQLSGYVVRIACDYTGYLVNIRFDRTEGDWSGVDQWLEHLARTANG